MVKTYLERAAEKKARQILAIPPEWRLKDISSSYTAPDALNFIRTSGLMSPEELALTEVINIGSLLQEIALGKVTALYVTKVFCKRAAIAHQLTSCCTEIFFEEAYKEAEKLDHILSTTGRTVGVLHGLPVSVKDSIQVKGQDTTIGWVGLIDRPAGADANSVTVLRKLGAVLYVKTNVPQSLMMSDSYNHVFGQCLNTLNRNLISGGSSGGESSLISAHGSPLGIGTDIGGSIRIPAALCGLYGLSPSMARHPHERGGAKQNMVLPVAGPITTSLASIEFYMEALHSAKPWEIDPRNAPLPWRAERCSIPARHKLRIGYVIDDGVVKPQPPIARAVKQVVEALRTDGHEVMEWDSTSHAYAYELFRKAILSDGGAACKKMCDMSGEPLIEGLFVGTSDHLLTTTETHELHAQKFDYEATYLARWYNEGFDALIMPVTPWVGYKPWTWVKSNQYVGYTSIFNLLDWPALTVPVTKVSKSSDEEIPQDWLDHQGRNLSDEFNKQQYDFKLVEGMPVGVQVICGKYEDEKCIAVGKLIRSLLDDIQE
ncbi:amidase signature domain-containing protein [Bisporella sp. PMI_857]|nr:amidase signature domain-containing protein [Bisporella sp. PMI_857]